MRILCGTILAAGAAVAAIAAHGAALLEVNGLVTEKAAGWRFEASGAKGDAAFNPLEGWYPDKGGKLVSPRIAISKAGAYYKLSFTGSAPVRSYETVALYDAAGNMIADNYDVIYGEEGKRYERVVFAQEGVKEAEVFFQSPKGCTVSDVKFEPATVEDAAKWCDGVYAKLPPLDFASVQAKLPPKTLDALKTGKPWRILMLGDSIMQDTFHSQFHALVKRAYPKSDVTWLVSVRGSTGCWYYCEPENFKKYVADYKPDCVFIGGISGWIHPEMPLNGGPAIESVARRVNKELGAEVVVMTPTLAIDLRVPKGTEQGTAVAPAKFDHAALGDRVWKYDVAAAEELKAVCAKNGWPLWDMFTPAYDWLFKTGLPSEFYGRDYVHSGELGKQIIGRIALGYFAAALELAGWKGETVSFRFDAKSETGGVYAPRWETAPLGWETKGGVMRGIRYMTKVHGTEYAFAPDRVEWNGATNLPPNGACIAVGQVRIPAAAKAGDYEMSFGGRAVRLHVVDRTLPPPSEWRTFVSGYWHHPWALARVTNTRLWSKEHFDAMRPFMAYTAAIGLKTIMCTICDLPWNHQCYDPNWTMVRHIKNGGKPGFGGTGEWSFDYTVFDKWVEFNLETGNGPYIYCYSLCPWDNELWYHDESGRPWHFNAKPGTKEYEEYWTPFLVDFRRHLIEKGWFDKVYIAADEREPEELKASMDLLRRVAPDFQVCAGVNGDPALFKDFKLGATSQSLGRVDDAFLERARRMIEEGRKVLFYVCCSPPAPNTFIASDPDDAFWLPLFAAAKGLSGFSRWTFDSFPEDAMKDATYSCWPSGDTFFVYPNGDPTWRYLNLLNGYQNSEKWRILEAEDGAAAAELERLGRRYDMKSALAKKDGDFRELVRDTLKALNRD